MHFPTNTVLARTISLGGRRLETQLMHYDGEDWQPYTYAWRDDQTDADLVPADGAEKEVLDGKRKRLWQFQSRSQCRSCHSAWSEYALGFQPEQLNRLGPSGHNQLVTFSDLGLIRRVGRDEKPLPAFDADSAPNERKLVDPSDETQPLEARARAYLHANCGHCHSNGGGGAVDLRFQFPVAVSEMKAVGVRPARGNFALSDAQIIAPGDPHSSTLYFRMAKFGRDRMPHLGSELPDEAGLALIEQWIASLNSGVAKSSAVDLSAAPEKVLADPKSAMVTARRVGRGELSREEQAALFAAVEKLTPGPIRDLFEGYLPQREGGRKLGTSPRPMTILSLTGRAGHGEKVFWSTAVTCGNCHKIGERGTAVGPDFTAIGKERTRDDLLTSILEPSRRIEPKFAAYVARATDGRVITGLVVKRDESGVVLRDSQNKEHVLAAAEIEQLQPSRTSLMAEGQMAGLTAQEAADLIEFLATRK
jgi:putative heme-binding domain-containing protein